MQELRIIRHCDLTEELLLAICEIKAIAWPYDLASQKKWINKNLLPDDLHVLLYDNQMLVAYANLVNVQFTLNNQLFTAFGIGNLCSAIREKGYGLNLITAINNFVIEQKLPGILFCSDRLLAFYHRCHWIPVTKEKITFQNLNEVGFETMLFNVNLPIESVVFADRLF